MAKSISCLRVAVGFHSEKLQFIAAKVLKGDVILGQVTTPQPCELYWHIHHGELIERQEEPIENRIDYITNSKPKDEVPTRLKLLRRVKNQKLATKLLHDNDMKGLEELHKQECKDCPWNGRTIFPEGSA